MLTQTSVKISFCKYFGLGFSIINWKLLWSNKAMWTLIYFKSQLVSLCISQAPSGAAKENKMELDVFQWTIYYLGCSNFLYNSQQILHHNASLQFSKYVYHVKCSY